MSEPELLERIDVGAKRCHLALSSTQVEQLSQYLSHLARWNRTINLTALPLTDFPAATLDRLIFEPLKSAPVFPTGPFRWFDFGSGGGSPAIPLRIVLPDALLTMIESRSRKAAFLRDAVRALGHADVEVVWDRIQNLSRSVPAKSVDVVTVRALRIDPELLQAVDHALNQAGRLVLFGPIDWRPLASTFEQHPTQDVGDVTVLYRTGPR